nr:MAG TPA: minor tail protein [Caudoviricetes sp.]
MANSDIIKIGFDYRASLAQFEKETNGVFDGISNKAGKQKITIQLDAKDDKVIDKIKELQKLKLDKFTFEFGNSGLKEQLQTFDKLENKINEIINLSKGIDLSFNTKNKTDAYNQLKKYADAFKDYYGNEEAMATNAGAKAGYAYYKAYEEALRKGVAQSKLEKVTIDFDVNDSFFSKERIVGNRIKEFENFQKYGNADESNLIAEITSLENRLLKFNSAYSQVKANLGDAPITPEITKNIEEYVRLLEVAESRAKDAELFGYSSEDINSDKDLANMYLNFAKEDATAENKKYIESLKQEETQAIATAEAEQKLAEAQMETVSNTSNSNNSQIEELKSDIQEVKTELGDVKDRISSIESNGFENVRDDVEKTKESAKELNSELTEMKSNLSSAPQESNISSGRKDAFPKTSENLEQVAQSEQKVQQEAKAIQSKWEQAEKAIQNYMNAVTKLNNLRASDKSTGKKSYEIAGQIEEIEKLKKEAYDARQVLSSMINPQNVDIDTWKRYVDVINRLDQASNGSAESVNRLKDSLKNTLNSELNSLQNSIDKYQNIITQAQTYPSDFHPSTEYNTKLANLESANNVLKNYKASLQGVNELTKEQQAEINKLTQNCEKAATEFKKLSAAEKGTVEVGIEKAIQRINKDLAENTKYSAEAKAGFNVLLEQLKSGDPSINLRKITEEIIKIENAEIAAGRAGKSLWDIFKTKSTYGFIGQMQSYLSMYVGFYGMVNAAKSVVSTVTELNSKIINLAKVSENTSKQIYADFSSYADIAKDMGDTISDTFEAATNWAKNGYNIPDSKELARVALLYKNVGDNIDITSANESLVSTLKGFSMEADQVEHIVDVFNEVSNNEAISSAGIGEAIQRSAAAFNAANTSLEKSVALITTTNSVVQNPDKVGNMWKVVSARLRGSETELKEMGEDTDGLVKSTSKLQALVKGITGFDIMKDENTYKDIYDIVLGISKTWSSLKDIDKASLLEALAGKMQSNSLAAAFANPEILVKSYQEAMNSAGSAAEEEKKYQQSVQYSIDQTKAKLEELSADLLSSDFLKGAIDAGGKLIEVLDGIVKSGNAIPTLLAAIGAALSFKNIGKCYVSA